MYIYIYIYICMYRVFKKVKKTFFKTFRCMSSPNNSLYHTFKKFLQYFPEIFRTKLSL